MNRPAAGSSPSVPVSVPLCVSVSVSVVAPAVVPVLVPVVVPVLVPVSELALPELASPVVSLAVLAPVVALSDPALAVSVLSSPCPPLQALVTASTSATPTLQLQPKFRMARSLPTTPEDG
jgi:hypothetical protein